MQKEDKKHYCPFTISGWKRGGGVWGDLLLLVMYSKLQMAYCQLRLTKAAQLQATVNFSCAAIAFVLKGRRRSTFKSWAGSSLYDVSCSFVSPSLAPSTTLHLFPIHQSSSPSFLSLSSLCLSFSLSLWSDQTSDVVLTRSTTRTAVLPGLAEADGNSLRFMVPCSLLYRTDCASSSCRPVMYKPC